MLWLRRGFLRRISPAGFIGLLLGGRRTNFSSASLRGGKWLFCRRVASTLSSGTLALQHPHGLTLSVSVGQILIASAHRLSTLCSTDFWTGRAVYTFSLTLAIAPGTYTNHADSAGIYSLSASRKRAPVGLRVNTGCALRLHRSGRQRAAGKS